MQRKLTVIFSADVVGYSGLMERDEAGTLARLKENRKSLFDPCVAAHGGRIFKVMGDGVLIEFPSAVSAVTCALEIQRAMETGEAHQTDADRLRYRIGINLGDVIIEDDDIYGDGVNVAARLHALAPAGGVTLARNVSDQVTGKVAAEFDDLGLHTVKNIERPIQVFALRPTAGVARPLRREAEPRVSICVLPFANMSGDSEQEYFSDGISEDIITDLSKVSALLVIARNTAFTFKGKHVDVPQVARQLNVSHVLEGSVRKSGGRVRITAQLIDAATGGHVWAERYDRDLHDIFALQDEISRSIVAALKVKLLPEEKQAIERRDTTDPDAYKLFLMARQYSISGNLGAAHRGETIIRLCRKATEIDPNYARAWALMANAQSTMRLRQAGETGRSAAEKAIALDSGLAEGHAAMARVLVDNAQPEESLRELEIALSLDPESYEVNVSAGSCLYAQRQFARAKTHFQKAVDIMEGDYHSAGMRISCCSAAGDREGARRAAEVTIARAEKILAVEADSGSAMAFLVSALAVLGEVERAKAWAERAMLLDPDNHNMRYNIACTLSADLREHEAALDLLGPIFETANIERINRAKTDPDLDGVRDHPRFIAMIAQADARLAGKNGT